MLTKHIGVNHSYFSPVDSEPAFSWLPCDSCNSTLGGMRYEVTCREGFCNPQGEILLSSLDVGACECFFVESSNPARPNRHERSASRIESQTFFYYTWVNISGFFLSLLYAL